MKFLRYKLLSQYVDTTNLYQNLTILSELFLIGNSYVVFLKSKTSNEILMVKETFAGGFEVIKIPLNTWGITLDRWVLTKAYDFKKTNLRFLSFKINAVQYLSILENDSGQSAIYIDSTDDTKAVNFIESACPLVTTTAGGIWTIHSFNQKLDGTSSSVLYSSDVTWDVWTETLTPPKLNSVLTTNQFSHQTFTLLINDTAGTNMYWSYAILGGDLTAYLSNPTTFQTTLLNQVNGGDMELVRVLDQSAITDYLALGITQDMPLVFCSNTSAIQINSSGSYIFKNILKYLTTSDFSYVPAFHTPELKYNMIKQILFSLNGVTDISNVKISRLVLDANSFAKAETNISVVNAVLHKESGLWLADAQSIWETLVESDIPMTSSIIQENICWD